MISIHWEVIVGSIYSYSFILLVSQHWDVIIVSLYAHYKFLLFYLSHPRFDLSLFVSFFRFSSLGHHLMFYLCSFLVPLVSHHWDAILDSSFYIKLIYLFLFFFHHQDVILGSIYVEFSFIWFPIIGMSSYVLPRISRLFLSVLIIVTPSQFVSMFVLSCFGFQTLGCHPTFCIGSLLVPLISNHWEVILSSIYGCSFVPLISHH